MKIINAQELKNINSNTKVREKEDNEFGQKMDEKRSVNEVKVKLKNLLERIDVQAKRLSNRMSLDELKEYKKLVSEFLNIAVNNSHEFTKERFLDSRGRHRVFSVVKKVNEEIENLTQEIMKSEKNRIGILASIDDIRGMLLDLAV